MRRARWPWLALAVWTALPVAFPPLPNNFKATPEYKAFARRSSFSWTLGEAALGGRRRAAEGDRLSHRARGAAASHRGFLAHGGSARFQALKPACACLRMLAHACARPQRRSLRVTAAYWQRISNLLGHTLAHFQRRSGPASSESPLQAFYGQRDTIDFFQSFPDASAQFHNFRPGKKMNKALLSLGQPWPG